MPQFPLFQGMHPQSYQPQSMYHQQPMYYPPPMQQHVQYEDESQIIIETEENSLSNAEQEEEDRYLNSILEANNDLRKSNWTILQDDTTTASKAGYDNAWNQLEKRLESGQLSSPKAYQYETQNPYLYHEKENLDQNIDALLQEAIELYEKGQINESILKFEALAQHPKGKEIAEVWFYLGKCHTENDNDDNAILALEKAMDLDPYHLNTLLSLGTCYVNELDSLKALETLRTWVANNPKFLGLEVPQDEYSDGTLMDEVIQLMLAVARHSPNDLDVQVLLGVLYNISLDYNQAVDGFQKALTLSPGAESDYSLLNKVRKL
jgi:peroxin-5